MIDGFAAFAQIASHAAAIPVLWLAFAVYHDLYSGGIFIGMVYGSIVYHICHALDFCPSSLFTLQMTDHRAVVRAGFDQS